MSSSPKSRGLFFAGNWKMNHTPREAAAFFEEVEKGWPSEKKMSPDLKLALYTPTLTLTEARAICQKQKLPIQIGAQNAHWEKSGAFTGEISGPMLKEAGIESVLIGHSERRQLFGETNDTVHKRTRGLLNQGFSVLMCIGETREQREDKLTGQVLIEQLSRGIPVPSEVSTPYLNGRLAIAYEPVWAIGTGLVATPEQAEEAHAIIRQFLEMQLGSEAATQTPILYGGSVTAENFDTLMKCPNVDGALVGGASLKASSYLSLLKKALHLLEA